MSHEAESLGQAIGLGVCEAELRKHSEKATSEESVEA